jgi:hypothetical protein
MIGTVMKISMMVRTISHRAIKTISITFEKVLKRFIGEWRNE